MDLVADVYRLTATLPREEKYGLAQQMNRAAVSVPSNIAEGHGRDHLGDYLRQLSVANGSLMEVETQAQIAVRLGFLSANDGDGLLALTGDVGRMLAGLVRALKRRARTPDT
jgi:four helix bundle protein